MNACIIRTGVANSASVAAALERCGVKSVLTVDRAAIEDAELVVLPGVGTFGAGMAALQEAGIASVLAARVRAGRAMLAICLGMQLLARSSEESAGVAGLGVVDVRVTRFPTGARTPQFGWNVVRADRPGLIERGYAYFANSYRIETPPAGWEVAWSDHAGPYVSAMWRGRVLACQFHPELSGAWGAAMIRRWCAAEAVPAC